MDEPELQRCRERAQRVKIVRDDWGIAHVQGQTDADAIFGLIYAQAEDDFNRIETNYLSALGRLSEAEGESAIYRDLRVKLFVDPEDLKSRHAACPDWLKALTDAWADGLNYYLAIHPQVRPRVITRFEPWMALSFVEGGVLGDIARIAVEDLQAFYSKPSTAVAANSVEREVLGSNAFAIAPSHTRDGHALLWINPHPEFYFRSEVQVQSAEGLNCYGAVTWGQFFIYHGFNEWLGWGHTTSGTDTVDEYSETIVHGNGRLFYRHGEEERLLHITPIDISYRTRSGSMAHQTFTVYRTHHGPIIRQVDGRWISIALMYRPVEALIQSFLRMKARNYAEFIQVSRLRANSVANTVYADAAGNIAYWPPQFVPRRDDRFDFTQPVNGADPDADWKGEHELDELPHVFNPPNGWIANTNNSPYLAAGSHGPDPRNYPRYMDAAGENPRGVNAVRVLEKGRDFTLNSLVEVAYDSYISAFARLIPTLITAYDRLPASHVVETQLKEQIEELRAWDYRQAMDSVATTLAVFWGEQLLKDVEPCARALGVEIASTFDYFGLGKLSATFTFRGLSLVHDYLIESVSPVMKLNALAKASRQLTEDFGSWRTPWGDINRFQRLSGGLAQHFDDEKLSTPVALTSSFWGSLACFKANRGTNTKLRYGISGNGFVMAVEFGDRVRALAASVGGASSDPTSSHFNDQATRVFTGDLRPVYFYADELQGHTERAYRPGD